MKEQEILKIKEKNKLMNEIEESKRQSSARSSISKGIPIVVNTPSYDERKPSILDDKDNNTSTVSPEFTKKSVVAYKNSNFDKRTEGEECFCDNSCTGNLFSYQKKSKK